MTAATGIELLTVGQMAGADRRAVAAGVASLTLMENAGRAVADAAARMAPPAAPIAVLCGPGNNGGDGFVAARLLAERGFCVRAVLLGDATALAGDAAAMARRYAGTVHAATPAPFDGAGLIVDALFGAGLSRPLAGAAADLVRAANAAGASILAVDVPSGLAGDTGRADGAVIEAARTVTFFRRKPGHLLLPGRALCGEVEVACIGIPASVLDGLGVATFANAESLWRDALPWPQLDGHKFDRGHALVVSGPPECTGAARLAARGALRVGAGLVTVATTSAALAINAAHLTAIMLRAADDAAALQSILTDPRMTAVLIGPGAGVGQSTRDNVLAALAANAACVLDADALTVFAPDPASLFVAIADHATQRTARGLPPAVVLTPHDGEFARLFPQIGKADRLTRARVAAVLSGAVIILKGADTVIAAPDGRAAINANAPPWLATAGSGDVLAGFVTGLIAQGMPAFPAAAAAVWLAGACANRFGPGLIAEDLPEMLPQVLAPLHALAVTPRH